MSHIEKIELKKKRGEVITGADVLGYASMEEAIKHNPQAGAKNIRVVWEECVFKPARIEALKVKQGKKKHT